MGHVSEGVVQSVPLVHLSWPHLLICEFFFHPFSSGTKTNTQKQGRKRKKQNKTNMLVT